jgi:DNA-binding NarL/FixJ family response regulator
MEKTQTPDKTSKSLYRILLVDDHPIVREGLEARLSQDPGLEVCGSVSDANQALDIIPRVNPDLVIADLSLSGRPGLDLVKDLDRLYPNLPVLVLSLHDEKMWAERVLRAGAKGFISKGQGTQNIIDAIRRILDGGVWVSEQISARLLQNRKKSSNPGADSPLSRLSDREVEVFQMLGQGQTIRDIATRLSLSPKTVEVHREHIKGKLGLKSSSELLRYAVTYILDPT